MFAIYTRFCSAVNKRDRNTRQLVVDVQQVKIRGSPPVLPVYEGVSVRHLRSESLGILSKDLMAPTAIMTVFVQTRGTTVPSDDIGFGTIG